MSVELAERLIGESRYTEAASLLTDYVRTHTTEPMAYHVLGLSLAFAGDTKGLSRVTDEIGPKFGDPIIFFQNVCLDLMKRGAFAVLSGLPNALPLDRRYAPVAVYFRGCASLANGEREQAMKDFFAFRDQVRQSPQDLPLGNANFNLIYRQTTLLSKCAEVAAVDARDALESEITWIVSPSPVEAAPERSVIATAADAAYFVRFAETLAASLSAVAPGSILHFHLADWDADVRITFDRILHNFPMLDCGLTINDGAQVRHNVAFACERFFVLPTLLDRYGAYPVCMLDIDTIVREPLRPLFDAAEGADFACFDSGRTEPSSIYLAGCLLLGDTPRARRILKIIQHLCLDRFADPPQLTWMLDQAAMLSAIRYLLEDDSTFRLCEFSQALGCRYNRFFEPAADASEKLGIMESARKP